MDVSIHAPTRGATVYHSLIFSPYQCFNPRTHEGCDSHVALPVFPSAGFNPRTHEGCDTRQPYVNKQEDVSIHAPTRGATIPAWILPSCCNVSIHAPTRGATLKDVAPPDLQDSFNPRTHEGCDREIQNSNDWSFVSIHAPTRGATSPTWAVYICRCVSIHAPTRGATPENPKYQKEQKFQSTHPRGVRQGVTSILSNGKVSIHAPTRGATAYSAKYRILIYKSSHFANINQTITFKVIKSLEFL